MKGNVQSINAALGAGSSQNNQLQLQAKALASMLRQEMDCDVQLGNKAALVKILYAKAPERSELDFQIKEGVSAPKLRLSDDIAADEDFIDLFCIMHSGFVPEGAVDVDHVSPHAKLRQKQDVFLLFLNQNKALAKIFLEQEGMSDYFQWGGDVVKGTKYFFKLCYNALDNLFLICHACNNEKSNHDPLAWFRSHPHFGVPFIEALMQAGGFHEGLVLPRVAKLSGHELKLQIGGRDLVLHAEPEAIGFGRFVRNWFLKSFQGFIKLHQQFYTEHSQAVKAQLEAMRHLIALHDVKAAEHCRKDTLKMFAGFSGIQAAFMDYVRERSSSGSDDDATKQFRVAQAREYAMRSDAAAHAIKKITPQLAKKFGEDGGRPVLEWCNKNGLLEDYPWERVCENIRQLLEDNASIDDIVGLLKAAKHALLLEQAAEEKIHVINDMDLSS